MRLVITFCFLSKRNLNNSVITGDDQKSSNLVYRLVKVVYPLSLTGLTHEAREYDPLWNVAVYEAYSQLAITGS